MLRLICSACRQVLSALRKLVVPERGGKRTRKSAPKLQDSTQGGGGGGDLVPAFILESLMAAESALSLFGLPSGPFSGPQENGRIEHNSSFCVQSGLCRAVDGIDGTQAIAHSFNVDVLAVKTVPEGLGTTRMTSHYPSLAWQPTRFAAVAVRCWLAGCA